MNKQVLVIPALLCLLSIISIQVYSLNEHIYYSVVLGYDEGNISLDRDINLIEGELRNFVSSGEYTISVYSFNDERLFSLGFDFPLFVGVSTPDEKKSQLTIDPFPKKSSRSLFIPYYSNAKQMKIIYHNDTLLNLDVSEFATCNENKICDDGETHLICPADCLCGDGVCGTNETYENCSPDCEYVPPLRTDMSLWERIWDFIISIFT